MSMGRTPLSLLFTLLLGALLGGCGRPATEQECSEIVRRITELELKARGISSSTEDVKETQQALQKTILHDCVGRRISDEALACVRNAKTGQQIVRECF